MANAFSQANAPPIRDVIIPVLEGSNAQGANPAGRAHLLLTRTMEARIRANVQSPQDAASGGLPYNGGQVMTGSPVVYLVFYQPPGTSSFSAGYATGIEAFFSHASGSSFASIWTQYTDSSGNEPDGTFTIGATRDPASGAYLDSTAIPPSGSAGTQANPLTDGDIQN
jgi:hypothetical protein